MSAVARPGLRARLRRASDWLANYLPVLLMGLLALATYLLARNTPVFGPAPEARPATHQADYFMRRFSVKSFDAQGRLKSEVVGVEGRHYPDTDTMEIDQPRIVAFNARGDATVATARRAVTNADGSQVQLIGDAVVTREAVVDATGLRRPGLQIRSEFLHVFVDTEQVRTHKPVVLVRGEDRFTADQMDYDNLDMLMNLQGRVRGLIAPKAAK